MPYRNPKHEGARERLETIRSKRESDDKAAGEGSIRVTSEPRAMVFMDDLPLGETPISETMSAGEHQIEIRKKGYKSWTKKITIKKGETIPLGIKLQKADKEKRVERAAPSRSDRGSSRPSTEPNKERATGSAEKRSESSGSTSGDKDGTAPTPAKAETSEETAEKESSEDSSSGASAGGEKPDEKQGEPTASAKTEETSGGSDESDSDDGLLLPVDDDEGSSGGDDGLLLPVGEDDDESAEDDDNSPLLD